MENEKTLVQYKGKLVIDNGILKALNNFEIKGYEIHQGVTNILTPVICKDNVFATYIHGVFW